jgi:hypothetical protein
LQPEIKTQRKYEDKNDEAASGSIDDGLAHVSE